MPYAARGSPREGSKTQHPKNEDKRLRSVRFESVWLTLYYQVEGASQATLEVKNLPANAGVTKDTGSICALGRSPGGGIGNPLQCSYLENLMDWRIRFSIKLKNRYEQTRKGVSKQEANMEVINIGMALWMFPESPSGLRVDLEIHTPPQIQRRKPIGYSS